jgi:copper(I)-binding protein
MKPLKSLLLLCVLATLSGIAYVLITPGTPRDLHLSDGRAAPIKDTVDEVGIFLTINNMDAPDRLIAAYSSAGAAQLEGAQLDGANLPLAIPAQSTPEFSSDGVYLRLTGVMDLTNGRLIPVTLEFEHAGERSIQARLFAPKLQALAAAFDPFGGDGICKVGEGEPAPRIALSTSDDSDGTIITVETNEFEFTPELADGLHIPGTGHGHLYLNGMKLQRMNSATARINALPAGDHEVSVTLNTNDHRAYVVGETPVTARAVITVP